MNTEKEYFTPEDLKKALKEFKVNKIDDEDTEVRIKVTYCKAKIFNAFFYHSHLADLF